MNAGPVRNFESASRSFNLFCSALGAKMDQIRELPTQAGAKAETDLPALAKDMVSLSQGQNDWREGFYDSAKSAHPEAFEAMDAMLADAADRAKANYHLTDARICPLNIAETPEAGTFALQLAALDPANPKQPYDAGALIIDTTPNQNGTIFVNVDKPELH